MRQRRDGGRFDLVSVHGQLCPHLAIAIRLADVPRRRFRSPAQAFSSVELIFVRYGPHAVSPIAHINFPDDFSAQHSTEFRRGVASVSAREKCRCGECSFTRCGVAFVALTRLAGGVVEFAMQPGTRALSLDPVTLPRTFIQRRLESGGRFYPHGRVWRRGGGPRSEPSAERSAADRRCAAYMAGLSQPSRECGRSWL